MDLTTEIVTDEADLGPLRTEWDALAVETAAPFCAPAWMLAWWRHARPTGATLRVVAVRDGDRLVGLAPLFARSDKGRNAAYDVLTERLSPPAGPLAAPGREREVAAAIGAALAEARPRLSSLQLWSTQGSGDVASILAEAWPGRAPWLRSAAPEPVPVVTLTELDYDGWFAGRSSKFRQESRRMRRRLEDAEAGFELVGPEGLEEALAAFVDLHGDRWQDRGGSDALVTGLRPMLADAAGEMLDAGRMRVYALRAEDRLVAVNVLLVAGGEICGWSSGFDEEWARFSPSMQLTLQAIDDATQQDDARMSLGPGEGGYKRRLADTGEEIVALTLVPRGASYYAARLRLLPAELRAAVAARLSPESKQRLRRFRRRPGGR